MTNALFVYGSLVPGGPNQHILSKIGGTWEKGSVRGFLHNRGWGAKEGFSGIKIDSAGELVPGLVLTSPALKDEWPWLDAFEGSDYRRVVVEVLMADGTVQKAYIYE
ncbi:MAG: gamma-glutamylcyclotransferase family protein, partial [Sphingomonadales bacterium]